MIGIQLLGLLAAWTLAVLWLCRHPSAGLWLAATAIVFDTFFGFDVTAVGEVPSATVFGLNIYALDVLAVLFFSYGIVRLAIDHRVINHPFVILIVQVIVVFVSTAVGAQLFGAQRAGNNSRLYIWLFAFAIYPACIPKEFALLRQLTRVLTVTSIVLVVTAISRWTLISFGLLSMQYTEAASGETVRVLNAGQTLLIASTAVLTWYARRVWRSADIPRVEMILLPAIVLLQHRTVWVAAVGTTAVILYRERVLRVVVVRNLAIAAVATLLIGGVLLPGRLAQSLATSASDQNSFVWRVDGWSELLSAERYTELNYLFGHPIGSDYTRGRAGRTTAVQAHNHYVQTFYDFGITGIVFMVAFYWLAFRGGRRGSRGRQKATIL